MSEQVKLRRTVWIRKRKRKGKRVYDLRWFDNQGKQHSEMVGYSHADAKEAKSAKERELNQHGDIQAVTWTVFQKGHVDGMRAEISKDGDGVSASYVGEHLRVLTRFAKFCHKYVCRVTREDVDAFKQGRLESGASASTVNGELRIIRAALSHAVALGYIVKNPAKGIKPMRVVKKPERKRVLSQDESRKLLDACPNVYWKAFIYCALSTGMRRWELLGLEWADVDLLNGVIQVRNKPGRPTKNRKERTTSTTKEGIGLLIQVGMDKPDGETKVFRHVKGQFSQRAVLRAFGKRVKAAEIAKCTLHDLRRTHATEAAKVMPAAVLMQRLGHASVNTTMEFYVGKVDAVGVETANKALGSFLGTSTGSPR